MSLVCLASSTYTHSALSWELHIRLTPRTPVNHLHMAKPVQVYRSSLNLNADSSVIVATMKSFVFNSFLFQLSLDAAFCN